jgi:hypothetical protein
VVIRALLGMAIAVCSACSYRGGFVDCEISCTQSTGCPPGFTCSASSPGGQGLCRSGTASCSAIFDGGVDGGVDAGVDGGVDGSVDAALGSCPAAFGAGRYLFVNMLMEWSAAEAYCKSLDSTPTIAPFVHLVVVNNATELGQLTPTGTPMDDAWLGYTDSKLNPGGSPDPAKFLWITGEQSGVGFAMWQTGQPDDSSGPRCAYKNFSDGLMHDRTCTGHTRTFFCECDQFAEDPAKI